MVVIRYVNDYGDGTSGYLDYGSGIVVTTASGQPIEVTSSASGVVSVQPGGVGADAFGRLRSSSPLTLFDSSHRYEDNGLWTTSSGTGGTTSFNANAGLVDLSVTTASGSEIIRETTKVCSYQPGKSLLVMSTFVMNAPKAGLRQRIGYYGANNGVYLEKNGTASPTFVERSYVTGALTETSVAQSSWNIDKLDGTGASGVTLDLTKAQILFMDIEWLGLGTVRMGFVIDGKLIHCHSFHHANLITSTYITTASLPLRYEIKNLFMANSVLDSVLAQYEKNATTSSSQKSNISQEDRLKKYFSAILQKNEKSASRRIRILPTKDGSSPFVEVWYHEIQVNGQWVKLYDPDKNDNQRSPLTEVYNELISTGKKEDKELASQYRSRLFYIVKVISTGTG